MAAWFILITIFTTESDYKRGFGDGIAASKSASASTNIERFGTIENCEFTGQWFVKLAGGSSKYKCIDLRHKKPIINTNINKGAK